jgi:hypothetical protein
MLFTNNVTFGCWDVKLEAIVELIAELLFGALDKALV